MLWRKQARSFWTESADDSGSAEADIFEDTAKSHRAGERNTFALGKPAVHGTGTRSDRGARTKSAIDHQEQSKDDRHDARTLARLARIDPELLGPIRHRSVRAQIHLTVIRARAELVSARTDLVNAARGLVKSYGQRLPKCGT